MIKYITPIAAVLILTLSLAGTAAADTFGTGLNQFDIDFVMIGNPGNPDDTTGDPNPAGKVEYTYRMGKFEISEDMIEKANAAGVLGITKDTRGPDKPATSVNWNEAARFVNWLNTSSGSVAAYKFSTQPGDVGYNANEDIQLWDPGDAGYNSNNRFRNSQARYFLPSYDEWYKAAHYDPTSGTYFKYPTGGDTKPTAVASGTTAGTAVYVQSFYQDPADITQAGGLSPYGTMGQGGNVFEWEESEFDLVNDSSSSARGVPGGGWFVSSSYLRSSKRGGSLPSEEWIYVGFRVASVLVVLGDANDDGVLNNDDILTFVQALTDPIGYAAAYPNVDPDVMLDMNNSGAFDSDDILGFVSALTGGP